MPFDETEIRIDPRVLSLEYVITQLRNDRINLSPGFQRKKGLWPEDDQSLLIESLLIRIPIPVFYMDATTDKWLVVDGVQRLTAFARFVMNEQELKKLGLEKLKLNKLEFLDELKDKTFEELDTFDKARILETQLTLHIIDPSTPPAVKYNIFKRINTGGLVLSNQEIRNAFKAGPATELLAELAQSDEFLDATHRSIKDDRGTDQEYILRFIAFREWRSPSKRNEIFKKYENCDLDDFLMDTMDYMNKMSKAERDSLEDNFKNAMGAARDIFGETAFRESTRDTINEALFDAWSVNLGALPKEDLKQLTKKREYLIDKFNTLLSKPEFRNTIFRSVTRSDKIKIRFSMIDTLLYETIEESDPWRDIKQTYPIGSVVENATVVRVTRNEVELRLKIGVKGLIRKSELSWTEKNPRPSKYFEEGALVKTVVTGIDRDNKQILLSHIRAVLREYSEGSTVWVKIIKNYDDRVLVELEEGLRGWIRISELSWTEKNPRPSESFKVNAMIEAVVKDIHEDEQNIQLSYREAQPNPWAKYSVGSKVQGTITKIESSYALVTLERGIEGSIDKFELSWIAEDPDPRKFFKVDKVVDVVVLLVDQDEQNIQLSYREAQPNPWAKYSVGSKVRGTITRIFDYGVWAKLERGIEGVIPFHELAQGYIERPEDVVSFGQELDLKVIDLEANKGRIRLSLKDVLEDKIRKENEQSVLEAEKRPPWA